MSFRKTKSLACTPPGLLKSINEDKQDVVRVSAIHSRVRLLMGAMGVPVMREDIAGSNPVNICMVGDTGDSRRPNAVHGHVVATMEGGLRGQD